MNSTMVALAWTRLNRQSRDKRYQSLGRCLPSEKKLGLGYMEIASLQLSSKSYFSFLLFLFFGDDPFKAIGRLALSSWCRRLSLSWNAWPNDRIHHFGHRIDRMQIKPLKDKVRHHISQSIPIVNQQSRRVILPSSGQILSFLDMSPPSSRTGSLR
jgi:hypothetical protein